MVRDFLPVIRAIVARELVEKYGLSQSEAASRLALTQASVSYYLSRRRGKSEHFPEAGRLKEVGQRVAKLIAEGAASVVEAMSLICNTCHDLRKREALCRLHEEALPPLKAEPCRLCER